MTRLEKKCLFVSATLHGLLGGILFFSAGFSSPPEQTELEVLTMIPPNLVDGNASGGGGTPTATPQRQNMARQAPAPAPHPQITPPPRVQPVVQRRQPEPVEEEQPMARDEAALLPAPRPRHHHEIHPTFTPLDRPQKSRRSRDVETSETASNSRAEQRRWREIESALGQLARGVEGSGASDSLVDVRGIGGGSGGGAAFAGYRQAIYSIYYNAWITPDSVSRSASVDVRIVVARDGTIISSEVISRSGEAAMDRSVRRALDSVTKLPPFPSGSEDEQRTFVLRFVPISNT